MFETEYFRVTETELQLLRSKYPYQKIPFEQLQRVELTYGSRVKYPIRTLIFGLTLIAGSGILLLQLGTFKFPMPGETVNPKGPLVLLIFLCTLIFAGCAAIWNSLVRTKILRTYQYDGTCEVFELKELRKTNQMTSFVQFLKKKLPASVLTIDRNWS